MLILCMLPFLPYNGYVKVISRKKGHHLNTMVNVKSLPTWFITLSIVENNGFILPKYYYTILIMVILSANCPFHVYFIQHYRSLKKRYGIIDVLADGNLFLIFLNG